MVRKLTSAILMAGVMQSPLVSALGLGDLTLKSALNQPLVAELELLNIGDLSESQILVGLADRDAFVAAGVDREYYLSDFRFRVELGKDGSGKIVITSKKPLNEPFINFLVETRWPSGRVLREYTALVDLPVYSEETETQVNLGTTSAYQQKAQQLKIQAPQPAASPQVVKSSPRRQSAVNFNGNNGGEYRIQSNDSLSKIAKRFRPASDVTVAQTMIAIQQLNPKAFIRNNINLLKAGSILRLPNADQVRNTSDGEANAQVKLQNQQWRNKETVAAGQLDARADGGNGQRFAGRDGQLRLSSDQAAETAGSGNAGSGSGSSDEVIALSLENEELETKVESLEQQVEKLQRLLELKNSELAGIQQNLGASEELSEQAEAQLAEAEQATDQAVEDADAALEAAIDATEAEEGAEEEQTQASDANAVEADSETVAEAQATEDASEVVAEESKPEMGMPEPAVVEPASQDTLTSMINMVKAQPWLILVLIVPILILLLVARRKKADADAVAELEANAEFDSQLDGAEENLDEAFAAIEEDQAEAELDLDLDAEQPETEAPEQQERVTSQTGDVVGEADIYVAYGRFDQAIALLKGAIEENPQQSDVQLKLLEVYLEAKDQAAAQAQLASVEACGDEGATNKARELLSGGNSSDDTVIRDAIDESMLSKLDELDAVDGAADSANGEEQELSNDFSLDLDTSADDDVAPLDEDFSLDLEADDSSAEVELEADLDELDKLSNELEAGEDEISVDSIAELEGDFSADALDAEIEAEDATVAPVVVDENAEISREDEVATKLDLARAYIDMGDVDGAKEILDEVLAEGEAKQQEEAQELMSQLA